MSDEQVRAALKTADEMVEHSTTPGFYDATVECELKALESIVFGSLPNGTESAKEAAAVDQDVVMEDTAAKTA